MLHEKVGKHGTRNRGRYQSGGSDLIEETLHPKSLYVLTMYMSETLSDLVFFSFNNMIHSP